jgi:hypothetical protein
VAGFADRGADSGFVRHPDDGNGLGIDIDLNIFNAGYLADPLREQCGATSAGDARDAEKEGHAVLLDAVSYQQSVGGTVKFPWEGTTKEKAQHRAPTIQVR